MTTGFIQLLAGPTAALRHRNFRIFLTGQSISLIGTWMQNMAQGWLVLTLTDSALLLGILTAVQYTPQLVFSLLAGVVADQVPKRTILKMTQVTQMCSALCLGFLVLFDVVQYWHILILAFILGSAACFDLTARQSYFIELVGKKDLMNAIAFNSTIVNIAKIVGPAVAGLVISSVGIAVCFILNGLSFCPVLIGLFMIDVPDRVFSSGAAQSGVLTKIREGLSYICRVPIILNIILITALINVFAGNFNVLIPVYAKQTLGLEAAGFGYLMSALGMGALLGALTMAVLSMWGPQRRILYMGAIGVCLFQIFLAFAGGPVLSGIFLLCSGLMMIIFSNSANTTLQVNTEDGYRGRVMSLYTMVFQGMFPLGSLFSGSVANHWGARTAFFLGAALALFVVLVMVWREIRYKTKKPGSVSASRQLS